jgi:hypothetical protein
MPLNMLVGCHHRSGISPCPESPLISFSSIALALIAVKPFDAVRDGVYNTERVLRFAWKHPLRTLHRRPAPGFGSACGSMEMTNTPGERACLTPIRLRQHGNDGLFHLFWDATVFSGLRQHGKRRVSFCFGRKRRRSLLPCCRRRKTPVQLKHPTPIAQAVSLTIAFFALEPQQKTLLWNLAARFLTEQSACWGW